MYFYNSFYLLEQLKKAISEWEQNYLLISSTNGIVSFQNFLGINQHISVGENIISIMPNEKEGIIDRMNIPSANSGKVAIGNKVLIKLDNYLYQEFGIIEGKVKNVSIAPDKQGNSYGILLSKRILEQAKVKDEVSLSIENNKIIIEPAKHNPRDGWEEMMIKAGSLKDREIFLENVNNKFEEEWTW